MGLPLGKAVPPSPASHLVRRLAAAAVAALALSACQDPAGVGLGLIDESQPTPSAISVPLAELDTLQNRVSTIGIASASADPTQARVLIGSVVDPTFGDASAVAYIDFIQPTMPSGTEASDVRSVWLELRRDYVYGDTTTALPVELRPISGTWEADTDYPVDTLFSVGNVLSTTTVTMADTLRRFDLPSSWVSSNAATLVGASFTDTFEGFALQAPSTFSPAPGAIYGFGTFSSAGSGLRVALPDDTLFFPLSEVFSSITTTPPPAQPDILPVRATSRASLRFTAPIDTAAVRPPLSRAALRLPLETAYTEQGTFVRPLAAAGLLFGIRSQGGEESRTSLGTVVISDGVALLSNASFLTTRLQAVLLGTEVPFTRYELIPIASLTTNAASLSILPVRLPTVGSDEVPHLTLTVVGSNT